MRKKRLAEKKLLSIIKEVTAFVLFLFFVFMVAYSNVSKSSFIYKQLFINTFVTARYPYEMGLEDVSFK